MLKFFVCLVAAIACTVQVQAQPESNTASGEPVNTEVVKRNAASGNANALSQAAKDSQPVNTPPGDETKKAVPQAGNEPERFTMNMREADIRGFVQWIADRTKKNIIVHRSVRGAVTVISSRAVTPDEAYELFLMVLALNGFAAVDSDGAVMVIPNAEAKAGDIPFAGDETRRGEIVTSIISIEHSEASDFVATIKPLIPSSAHLAAYQPTNSLIVADTARSIDKINQIIAILDREEGGIDLEIVPIVHASAEDILGVIAVPDDQIASL